jgi:ADP-heptose:LPS heptosyltransferase
MTAPPLRVLCVPVSGAFGMGEYARSLAIVRALVARRPHAAVHFLVSRAAPYASEVPFEHTLLPASPTLHTPEVVASIHAFRPTLVLFDNAGRTAQLRAARAAGAKVVFVSARARQRRKAFRLSWMRLIDEHWIAYPAWSAGALGPIERTKLRWLGRPVVRFLDVILPPHDAARAAEVLARFGFAPRGYVVVVPGGGTGHPGAADAVGLFHAAAARLAAAGTPTLYVGPSVARAHADADAEAGGALRACVSLPQRDLAELLRGARLVIANGGSTLLQAIACGAATIGVAIAGDQGLRLRRCVAAGVAVAAPLAEAAIVARAAALLGQESERAALAARAAALPLADGITVAVAAIEALIA